MPSEVRRSARAPPPVKPNGPTTNSTASSLSSGRQDRDPRPNGQLKSATPHSLSSEDVSEPPRRSQRALPTKEEEAVQDDENADEAVGDEEEITRCICGHQEYPGPPLSEVFSGLEAQGDDVGGLFIQCDGCSVWQHGGCVGIVEESQCPDKYYCEECRPKLHDPHVDSRGQHATMARYHEASAPRRAAVKAENANRGLSNSQQYTNYLPLHPQAKRKQSVSKSSDNARRDRDSANSRASADPVTGRRRATMRSKEHDDEEEQLRRALEESKKEVGDGTGRRNGKRGREAGDDTKMDIKRQRTTSQSTKLMSRNNTVEDDDSDDDNTATSRQKKVRADAVQSAKKAELQDKEVGRERARAEAAGRRQERAGRRRVDEGDEDETPRPDTSARTSPPPSSQPPSPPAHPASDKIPQKRFPGKKVKKLGNNQYTKARELSGQINASSPHSKKRNLAPGHASSGDEQAGNGDSHPTNTSNSTNKNSPGGAQEPTARIPIGKPGKGKHKLLNGLAQSKHQQLLQQQQQPVGFEEMSIGEMQQLAARMREHVRQGMAELAGDRARAGLQVEGGGAAAGDGDVGGAVLAPSITSAPGAGGVGVGAITEGLGAVEMGGQLLLGLEEWERMHGVVV
ncbi:Histone deacetylase complex subunit [Recurvomyces mirabilis]|nr:Histone deacetylase complex subunit [Recurvomyces mirabilis]